MTTTTTTTPPINYDFYLIREKTLDDGVTVIGHLCNMHTGGEEWFTLENNKYIIPCGHYNFRLRKSPRFGLTPWLYNVDNREYILMHIGNTASDSKGCILVGDDINGGVLRKSRKGFERLMNGLAPMRDYTIRIEWQLF